MRNVIQRIYDTFDEVGRADPGCEPFADLAAAEKLEAESLSGASYAQKAMANLLRTGIVMSSHDQAVRMAENLRANGLDCIAEAEQWGGTRHLLVFETEAKRFEALAGRPAQGDGWAGRNRPDAGHHVL